jgi:hypothetical protein
MAVSLCLVEWIYLISSAGNRGSGLSLTWPLSYQIQPQASTSSLRESKIKTWTLGEPLASIATDPLSIHGSVLRSHNPLCIESFVGVVSVILLQLGP